jgi:hypothetical protein
MDGSAENVLGRIFVSLPKISNFLLLVLVKWWEKEAKRPSAARLNQQKSHTR